MAGLAYIIPENGKEIDFDLVMSEAHTSSSQVTDHPVEKGVNVADHVKVEPFILALSVYVSNTPLDVDPVYGGNFQNTLLVIPFEGPTHISLSAAIDAVKGELSGPPPPPIIQTLIFNSPFDKVADTHKALTAQQAAGGLLNVITSTANYDSMILTKVLYNKTEAGGGDFSLEFKQARIVSSSTVAAPQPLEPRGAPPKAKGAQAAKPPEDASQASVAKKGLNKAREVLGL